MLFIPRYSPAVSVTTTVRLFMVSVPEGVAHGCVLADQHKYIHGVTPLGFLIWIKPLLKWLALAIRYSWNQNDNGFIFGSFHTNTYYFFLQRVGSSESHTPNLTTNYNIDGYSNQDIW